MEVTPVEPESLAANEVLNNTVEDVDDEDECRVCRGPAEEG
jgi:hypothetical protein